MPDGQAISNLDALAAANVQPEDKVVMVGGFVPFIKALKGNVAQLWVIDKHPQALKPDEAAFWRSPEQAIETIAQADVVVITGSVLVEGGLLNGVAILLFVANTGYTMLGANKKDLFQLGPSRSGVMSDK